MVAAIAGLRPGALWGLKGDTYEGLDWRDTVQTKPTQAEIEAWVPPPPGPAPQTSVLYQHENRLRSLEGQPPLSLGDFLKNTRIPK